MLRSLPLAAALAAVLTMSVVGAQAPRPAPKPSRPSSAQAKAERAVPFRVGETLTYDVGWSTFLVAGTATVSVREKEPSRGSVAWTIVAEGQPTPLLARIYTLFYRVETSLDAYALLSQRGSVFSQEGSRSRTRTAHFDRRAHRVTYETRGDTVETLQLPVPPYTQDILSALFVLRTLAFRPGLKTTIPVFDGGDTFTLDVTVTGREVVRTGLGSMDAWKLIPVIQDAQGRPVSERKLSLWIADDPRRIPARLQAELAVGTFNLVLRDASM